MKNLRRPGKRMFHAQRLSPILQHVGVFAFGQLQTSIQRHELDFLPLSRPIHDSRELKLPENRLIAAWVRLLQSCHLVSIRHGQRLAQIPVSLTVEELAESFVPHLKHSSPNALLDFVNRLPSSANR